MNNLWPVEDDGTVAEAPAEFPDGDVAAPGWAFNFSCVSEQAFEVALGAFMQVPVMRIIRNRNALNKSGLRKNLRQHGEAIHSSLWPLHTSTGVIGRSHPGLRGDDHALALFRLAHRL